MQILVSAASRYGATAEIADALANQLRTHGFAVRVDRPENVHSLAGYDAVVLGSALYAGHWLAPARALVERCRDELHSVPVWLFSSGPVGSPQRRLVQKMDADPLELPRLSEMSGAREHRRFAGKLDRAKLSGMQRIGLSLMRGLEGDFRDWTAIRSWADTIAAELGATSARNSA